MSRADFRPATDDELPRQARLLAQEGRAHGWKVRAFYGRGVVGTLNGHVACESVTVRLYGPGYAFATWTRRADEDAWTFKWACSASRPFGYRELVAAVRKYGRPIA